MADPGSVNLNWEVFFDGLTEGLGRMMPTFVMFLIMALWALRAYKRIQAFGASTLVLYWDRHDHGAQLVLEPIRSGSVGEYLPASSRARAVINEVLRRRRNGLFRRCVLPIGWVLLFPIYLVVFAVRLVRYLLRGRPEQGVDLLRFTAEEWEFIREAAALRLKPLFGREYVLHANGQKLPLVRHFCVVRSRRNSLLGTSELQLIIMPEWHVEQIRGGAGGWSGVRQRSGGEEAELVQIATEIAKEVQQRAKGELPYGEPFAVESVRFPLPAE